MIIFALNHQQMITISFKLKDVQGKVSPAKQTQTLIYLIAGFEYFETKPDGTKKYLPMKYSTGLKIKPHFWKTKGSGSPEYRAKQTKEFEYTTFNNRLDDIESACKTAYREILNEKNTPTPELLRDRLDKKLEKPNRKAEREKETFEQFIERYVLEAEKGIRISAKGRPFKLYTLKNFKTFQTQFLLFQKNQKKLYNFNDINLDFYDDFVKFLNGKMYSPNTTGRHIRSLKIIMRAARDEGYHTNSEFERKRFKAMSVEVQSIYLSEAELKIMQDLDLSELPLLDVARDVFLIGCFTAQRFSDYSKISKENIRVQNGGVKVVDIVQEKTGERVIIPIRPELDQILQKYDYTVPKIYEQKLNARIKTVGDKAEINEKIRITEFKGGLKHESDHFKYDLIKTHTARRSGCTNMYLSGISAIDIMKLSGHKTEFEFLKYLKVTKEETASSLALHPYFNHLRIAK